MRLYLHSMRAKGFPLGRRPRHPLARFLSMLLGLAVIGVLLVFGLVVSGVLLVGGAIVLATEPDRGAGKPQPAVLEGEFRVIHQGRPVTH